MASLRVLPEEPRFAKAIHASVLGAGYQMGATSAPSTSPANSLRCFQGPLQPSGSERLVRLGPCDWHFFGAARIGEPLRARRRQVVLPEDLMETELKSAFVRVEKPKTVQRSGSRVQHFTVTEASFVRFLSRSLLNMEAESPLFHGSPSTFRRRWDVLRRLLQIPGDLRLRRGLPLPRRPPHSRPTVADASSSPSHS